MSASTYLDELKKIDELKKAFRQYLEESDDYERRDDAQSKFTDEWLMGFYDLEWTAFRAGYEAALIKYKEE